MDSRTREGISRLIDPKITMASMASLFLGTAAAWAAGPIVVEWLLLTVAGIFFLEVAKNASGEIVDFESGADRGVAPEDMSPFSGGKRVLVEGLLTRKATGAIAIAGYALTAGVGLAIVLGREPRVLAFGLIGTALAYGYHAGPLRLSYRGLGESAVTLCYGPLIACGTYLVQRGRVTPTVFLVSLPLGLLIGAFLWINEFPDFRADREAGKRTLVVRLGRPAAARGFAAIVGVAFALMALLPLSGLPRSVWLGALGLPFAVAAARRLLRDPETTARIVPAQGWTLLAFLGYAAGAGIGLGWAAGH
jgi:1,4-dihydroxy-2-naphthoate polyprenyltransferase